MPPTVFVLGVSLSSKSLATPQARCRSLASMLAKTSHGLDEHSSGFFQDSFSRLAVCGGTSDVCVAAEGGHQR